MSALLPAACQHVSDRHGKFRFQFCIAKGGRREVKKTKAAADMPCAICRTAGLSRSGNIAVRNIDTARYTANIVGSFRFCV
ncbi:Uncharacterised protein [Neisseria gonorrhoeae]|uniref:Uncharacterized protein n=1 Tax=Neisseria gonorrhoeae TaxID=485 RepID=A0A378VYW1_NEIGO|nr:Uncharacterised protein [Neisseria gonorrhoeae]